MNILAVVGAAFLCWAGAAFLTGLWVAAAMRRDDDQPVFHDPLCRGHGHEGECR